ncbi:hypothetical protein H2O64_17315 [Kordia sp. YSTF-M3]|jgi:hypothetical protein|uniref:Natural product n=1 Tax=Kordia aestuariivivens TaxID=2759037 RepID=A0ABR7QCY4_9FLAO|nr:hypothetical protein [Kordia aestuariivivens]MBC8756437.1 hypothetical protein [Kordia aestuariivivens]
MKKRNLNVKLTLGKNSVSNLESTQIKGGAKTDICTGLQETCSNCQGVTREWPCPQH